MNLKQLIRFFFLAFLLAWSTTAGAQCEYTLDLSDDFGDGWNDGKLVVNSGGTITTFTLNDGYDSTLTFQVTAGAPLTLLWVSGDFDDEVSFTVTDYDGNQVYQITFPDEGMLFTGTGTCPDCIRPINVKAENVYDTYAKLRWTPVSLAPSLGWWVIYGPKGFVPGPGIGDSLYVTTPKLTLTGLSKKTEYDFYVLEQCDSTNTAKIAGPVSFETYWSNDVGISGVLSPVSGCDLGVETVKIVMTNYGAKPQSLVPFKYSVNGQDAGVPQPQDGFFTGVLGKDSSEVIEFETTYNFSAPGEYLITVYTQMSGDEDVFNDTFNYYIVNRLITPYTQDFETWSGGWYVDTASVSPSWAFGTPAKDNISGAASGQNAWVTGLTEPYNAFELSYLSSPCFDFGGLTEDPVIQFSINYFNAVDFDGAYLEMSTDDGQSWNKVGSVGEGFNWYNTTVGFNNVGDAWSGDSEGWITARIRLAGLAGENTVRFRFVFSSTFFQSEGVGVDDIRIFIPVQKDLAGVSASSEGDENECGLPDDHVVFSFINFGSQPQSNFQVAYSINGGAPVVETVNATVQPDETFNYTFNTPFDSRNATFDIVVWTMLSGEQDQVNDTAYYSVGHVPKPLPFHVDFEDQNIPADWTVTGFPFVSNFNGNISYVLETNMWENNDEFIYDLPRYGLVEADDTLRFDYRITDFGSQGQDATVLQLGTKIDVAITTDCDNYTTLYSINFLTHTPTTDLTNVKIPLSAYAGKAVRIRFIGTWNGGDFYFDLDNINVQTCAANMDLSAAIVPSTNGQNGEATVNVGLGNPPYTYLWSNDSTGQTVTGQPVGSLTVTVTDALGCSDTLLVNIGSVAVQDIESLTSLSLRPNPSPGSTLLNAAFSRPVDAQIQVSDLLGRLLWETGIGNTTGISETIDLVNFPDGLYLVRLTVDGQTVTRKLVKGQP